MGAGRYVQFKRPRCGFGYGDGLGYSRSNLLWALSFKSMDAI